MIESMAAALATLLTGWHVVYLMIGVLLGLAVGIFPGLGGVAGLSLVIPFIYGMDQSSALGLMIGLLAVIATGDTFTSILLGIPGSAASQATILDGFPLAKRGLAARALSAAFLASLIGGVLGAVALTGFILIARPIVLAFGSAELFMLGILGLSMVGVLSGRSFAKGLVATAFGLLLGCVGGAPATGEWRFTFGTIYLSDGLPLVVIGLAAFAIPELVDLLRRRSTVAERPGLGRGWMQGLLDVIRHRWLVLRCSTLGCLLGAIPGLGGSVIDWIAYGHVVQTSRDKEQFGKGDIRGVIAPESATNAKEGGALVPTLLFGIPGSGGMAIFLGGLVLIGVQPGVSMLRTQLDLVYIIIWSLALANILGAGLCILLARPVARMTDIPVLWLAPPILVMIVFASFQATRSWGDLIALLSLGVVAVYMRRFGWPRPPLLIGFVLSGGLEAYFYQAIQFYGWAWFQRPLVLVLAAIIGASLFFGMRQKRSQHGREEGRHDWRQRMPQLLFLLFVGAVIILALVELSKISSLGGIFPNGVAIVALMAWAWVLVAVLRGHRASKVVEDDDLDPADSTPRASAERYLLWIGGLATAMACLGFVLGIALFVVVFLVVEASMAWTRAAMVSVVLIGILSTLSHVLVLKFPSGLLQSIVPLPWPLG